MQFGHVIIFVEDVAATIAFYKKAFNLTGSLVTTEFAEIETGSVKLVFGTHQLGRVKVPGLPFSMGRFLPPPRCQISFPTVDVESAYRQAVQAGATEVMEPHVMPWGQTVSKVRDLNYVLVSIVSPFENQA